MWKRMTSFVEFRGMEDERDQARAAMARPGP
jgi:hypothetical protein